VWPRSRASARAVERVGLAGQAQLR